MANKIYHEVLLAYRRIEKHIRKTPLEFSHVLSNKNTQVYLKLENMQFMGSFKTRGAFNKIITLAGQEVVTASTGNHGVSTAYALSKIGGKGRIFLPHKASKSKVSRLDQFSDNVELQFEGDDSIDTEIFARKFANKNKIEFVSPYNDEMIIAGQGTIGIELKDQLDKIDNIFITIGGGGLVSGVASYIKHEFPQCRIIGCLPVNSPVMYESVKAGKVLSMESKDTISDGSAGGLEEDSITFGLCRELVDEYVLVSEDEIKYAMKNIFEGHNLVIEGAAAVAVASFTRIRDQVNGNTVIIICGGNIDIEQFKKIVF